ncbi:MAG: hypothetical protein JW797_14270 [Bradymonadales bacterium]|nr:hypothetical protein [Bradymonadales bacterium]
MHHGRSDQDPGEPHLSLAEIIEDLLHDWIKYMEMQVNSIDWSGPADEVARLVRKSILQTRRFGNQALGVPDLWRAGREKLRGLDDPTAKELVRQLEGEVTLLIEITGWNDQRLVDQADQIREILRCPGRRLRSMRGLAAT